jgi:Uma2 family endonuclease
MSTFIPTETTTPKLLRGPAALSVDSVSSGETRIVFRGVDWNTYYRLSEAAGDGQHFHLIYDGKDLEIMVTSNVHEYYKDLIARIVDMLAVGLDLDYESCGETTWKTEVRGLEADLSYYFGSEKVRVAKAALARQSMSPAEYPRPDLAIEIDLSPPQVDRPSIYRDLGIAEVWRLTGPGRLIFEQLQPDGTYTPVNESRYLRIRPEDVLHWLNEAPNERRADWYRRLQQWAMALGTGR